MMNYLIPFLFGVAFAYAALRFHKDMGIGEQISPTIVLDVALGIGAFGITLIMYQESNALIAALSTFIGSFVTRWYKKTR